MPFTIKMTDNGDGSYSTTWRAPDTTVETVSTYVEMYGREGQRMRISLWNKFGVGFADGDNDAGNNGIYSFDEEQLQTARLFDHILTDSFDPLNDNGLAL